VGFLIGVASCIVLGFQFRLVPNLSARGGAQQDVLLSAFTYRDHPVWRMGRQCSQDSGLTVPRIGRYKDAPGC